MSAVCAVWIIAFSGCSDKKAAAGIEITDMAGRKVIVPESVERIVCKGPGALRLLIYLGAKNKICAIESGFETKSFSGRPYMMANPELARLPKIGPAGPAPRPDAELILKAAPDIVFMAYTGKKTADVLQEKTGIPVVMLTYGDLATFSDSLLFSSLELAGKIIGNKSRADSVITFIKKTEKDLRERSAGLEAKDIKKREAYVGCLGSRGSHGIVSTRAKYPPFNLTGIINPADKVKEKGHIFLDREKLIEWDPEIIFLDAAGIKHVKEDFKQKPSFYKALSAFRNDNVYLLFPYNFYTTNIGTALADAYYAGKTVYPEAYSDIDPSKKADEIWACLCGKALFKEMKNDWNAFKKAGFK
ncbi:MAG: iron ABC transporter substrate-binding protein [Fibrobacterota bacterium]